MYLRRRRGVLRVARSVAASTGDKKKTRDNQLGDVINKPTPILDGSAPSRCIAGRTCRASNCEHIMREENCIIIVTMPDEPDDATTSPSFDLDVFPDDSIILRCVVNGEICVGRSSEYHCDAELLCCAEVSTSS